MSTESDQLQRVLFWLPFPGSGSSCWDDGGAAATGTMGSRMTTQARPTAPPRRRTPTASSNCGSRDDGGGATGTSGSLGCRRGGRHRDDRQPGCRQAAHGRMPRAPRLTQPPAPNQGQREQPPRHSATARPTVRRLAAVEKAGRIHAELCCVRGAVSSPRTVAHVQRGAGPIGMVRGLLPAARLRGRYARCEILNGKLAKKHATIQRQAVIPGGESKDPVDRARYAERCLPSLGTRRGLGTPAPPFHARKPRAVVLPRSLMSSSCRRASRRRWSTYSPSSSHRPRSQGMEPVRVDGTSAPCMGHPCGLTGHGLAAMGHDRRRSQPSQTVVLLLVIGGQEAGGQLDRVEADRLGDLSARLPLSGGGGAAGPACWDVPVA